MESSLISKGIHPSSVNPVQITKFNTKRADWEGFSSPLKTNVDNAVPINSQEWSNLLTSKSHSPDILRDRLRILNIMDKGAQELTHTISKAAESNIPRVKTCRKAKAL